MSENIPVVDFRDLDAGAERRAAFIDVLGRGLERFGFVAVSHHGISPELLTRGYATAERFFALPVETKLRCEAPQCGRQRGYTPFGVEHAKDTAVPDLKEFFHVGRSLAQDHPLHVSGDIPPNVFPAELPQFTDAMRELFARLEGFALELLDAVGEYLAQPPSWFRDMVRDGNSVLRVINYPDMGHTLPVGAVRAAAHEDINLMTVLPSSTRPGLELLTRDGQWMAVETPPDVMICDTGDMMQLVTAGQLPATTHRVVNPEGADGGRMSMPFFLHPHPDALLAPLRQDYAEPILTRDFFGARMRATGVA